MVIAKNLDKPAHSRKLVFREFVLVQNKPVNLFNNHIVHLMEIAEEILSSRGVCRLMIHFSKDQFTCWSYGTSSKHKIFTAEEVFQADFMNQFRTAAFLAPFAEQISSVKIPMNKSYIVLEEFWRLWATNHTMCLRSAYINRINGSLSLTFSHDEENYILYSDSFDTASQRKFIPKVA